jgi:hypothetical protein
MKNIFKGIVAAISITFFTSASIAQNDNSYEKSGTILTINNSGNGLLRDQETGNIYEFERQGASITIVIGDAVSYRLITLPNGKPPVVIDIKRPN